MAMTQNSQSRKTKRGTRGGREQNQHQHQHQHHQDEEPATKRTACASSDCLCNHDNDHDDNSNDDDHDDIRHRHHGEESPTTPTCSTQALSIREGNQQVLFVDNLTDLQQIQDERVQLVVWRQSVAPGFINSLSNPSISPEDLPNFEGVVLPEEGLVAHIMKKHLWVPYKLRSHEHRKKALDERGIDQLLHQIEELVLAFASISKNAGFLDETTDDSQLPFVHVKLQTVTDNGCVFWHQDCVPFRMVSTLRGPCTEWVPPKYSKETLERRRGNSKHARYLSHCDIALFKGRGDTEEDDALLDQPGIVHRSPRIEGSGNFRLVLVLDIPQAGWHY